MSNFSEFLEAQARAPRSEADPVLMLARAWTSSDHGKIRSVSGIKKWFDDHRSELTHLIHPDSVTEALSMAVREYNAQRDGQQSPAIEQASDAAEFQREVRERLAGIEQALVWLVDAQAGQSAAQMAAQDSRSTQDWRDWSGADQTRNEAAALGLVTPAPGRSSVPGYEHVVPMEQPQANSDTPVGIAPPPGPLAEAMGLDADPALAAQRQAIAAEAARIQAQVPADAPPGAYYDESAEVQQVRPEPQGQQEWAQPAPQSYSPEQWRAWALTSDIPADE